MKVKWVVRRGTLAAAYVSIFFLVFEMTEQFVGSRTNSAYLGIAAAGALVFLFAPLQRLADRFAEAAVPNVKAVGAMTADERRRFYLDHAKFLWADGSLSIKDRRSLDFAAQRLSLSPEEARELEREAVNQTEGRRLQGAPTA